jgi:hypothetical protein
MSNANNLLGLYFYEVEKLDDMRFLWVEDLGENGLHEARVEIQSAIPEGTKGELFFLLLGDMLEGDEFLKENKRHLAGRHVMLGSLFARLPGFVFNERPEVTFLRNEPSNISRCTFTVGLQRDGSWVRQLLVKPEEGK